MSPKSKKAIGYGEAIAELDDILTEIEASDVDLDRLAGRVERASTLVKTLKSRIRETELKVTRVVEDLREEVARDDAPAEADPPAEAAGEALLDRDGDPILDDDDGGGEAALFDDVPPDEDVPF